MKSSDKNLTNALIHLGRDNQSNGRSVNLPIHQASTMLFNTLEEFEEARSTRYDMGTLYYGRYGTPATFELENTMTHLEQGAGCVAVSSGLTACVISIMSFIKAGDHILVADTVYGPTRAFCDNVLSAYGVDVTYFDPLIGADVDQFIQDNTQVVFFEAPGSSTFEVPNIPAISEAARKSGAVSILDGTWATPLYCQPLKLGVDVVVHSGSKYLSGHSDAMLGFIVSSSKEHYRTTRKMSLFIGDRVGGNDVFLALRGLRTLSVRLRQHAENTQKCLDWLAQQSEVERILYPAHPDCPGHEFWQRDFAGATGLFSVIFKPGYETQIRTMINSLSLFGIGLSWGGFESLAIPVDPSPFRTATTWSSEGPVVRFHIGLEDPESLILDLENGFKFLK
ncbi:cystathionine beta-lyase [Marinomonas algicola]|uniref:cystathionine beta-lyase n=1 Tax=Marinomonas algicola TaxID=2773454 RepID=UPI0017498A29|nr:cystathionine beta-lyase [Marinomonas algicola]